MADRRIDSAGVQLAAEEGGEGPTVVLLHGLTATRRYVVMGSKALERSAHWVIAYDARGHGASSPAPDPKAYGYDVLTADLEHILDAFAVDRAVLVGASMGRPATAFGRSKRFRAAGSTTRSKSSERLPRSGPLGTC